MHSPGTKQLIAEVEQTTGYKVVVDTIEGISEHAQMISARPEMPVHTIRVSKSKLPTADYIVAIQCAILLRTWSDPTRIPVFSPIPEKVRYLADRAANTKPLSQLPAKLAQETALQVTQGLLNQLRSLPSEIFAIRECQAQCHDLHEMQADTVESELRLSSETFAPKIRSFAPDFIWRNNVSMNSAYALNWSQLTDSTLPMLPYQSAGFSDTPRNSSPN
ncbi:MAG: hypothetical protein WCQ21_29640 [Verrucomicrobiota bacterium]|jgi:hypothetical protein